MRDRVGAAAGESVWKGLSWGDLGGVVTRREGSRVRSGKSLALPSSHTLRNSTWQVLPPSSLASDDVKQQEQTNRAANQVRRQIDDVPW